MSTSFRNPAGGCIERSRPIDFRFDSRRYRGLEGDTLASALLAHGVRLFGRSIKFRRPRGVLSCGAEEPSALVTLDAGTGAIPNIPATLAHLAPGLMARSQNRWPSLRFDLTAAFGAGGALYGAGFYYKTFMWPSWRWYEPLIRRLAGLGHAPERARVAPGSERYLSCDVLVIGAGPAGLAAAVSAATAGARVIVCEQELLAGGELQFEGARIDGLAAAEWVARTCTQLRAARVPMLYGTTAIGVYEEQVLALSQSAGRPDDHELLLLRPLVRIIATGAIERPIAFEDNDRPGVMLLGAVERYASRYAVRAGDDAVIFGNHDRLYPAALRLGEQGIRIRAIVDPRPRSTLAAVDELERRGTRILSAHVVERALGRMRVRGARIGALGTGAVLELPCDLIAVSGGWTPSISLALQSGAAPRYTPELGAFVAADEGEALTAGAAAGHLELSQALIGGTRAGARAAQTLRDGARNGITTVGSVAGIGTAATVGAAGDPVPNLQLLWRVPRGREKHQFVDLQNDVTVADLRQAVAEGFREIEHVKRYTTLGVGTDQGKTGGLLGAAIVAEFLGEPLATVGQSRGRPPVRPVPLATLAGLPAPLAVKPLRRTPLHDALLADSALMEPSGLWLRARHFSGPNIDPVTAGAEEARRVRSAGGLLDASTLGKIEVSGADAAAFLDRVCLGRPSRIAVGRARYAVLLREDGMVLDDGLLVRLAESHFLLTASTHGAATVLAHLQYHIATGPTALEVCCADATEAWGVIVVSGPKSRELVVEALPATPAAETARLPHLAWAPGEWRGRPLRILRASFSGELAYELHCAADEAPTLWQALRAAGSDRGVRPYGLEALDVLRIEKGYLTSAEINGQTSPYDLRLESWVRASAACIGCTLLERPALHEASRPMLVGLIAAEPARRFNAGAQLTAPGASRESLGYITSAAFSPTLDRHIALGLLARDHAHPGARVLASDPLAGTEIPLLVTEPVHFDPAGERMKG
ncbi:MAG: 2Fe-2S iron-sulfur cluster-binding protein [Steroidobacteraceae bacterium]